MFMRTPQDKLNQIKNLINTDFKQDAAHLLRQFLQQEPTNRQAWLLLSELTSGQAKVMCLKKAADCPAPPSIQPDKADKLDKPKAEIKAPINPDGDSIRDITIPYASFAGVRAKARQKAAPVRPQHQPARTQEPKVTQTPIQNNDRNISFGRWLTIGFVGVLLGFICIFILTRFAPSLGIDNQVNAQTQSKSEMVPAIVETAAPSDNTEVDVNAEAADPTLAAPEEVAQVIATATPEPTAQQLAAKPVSENNQPREAWTPTPLPTPTFTPTPTIEPTRLSDLTSFVLPNVGEDERWVDVNLTLQTLTAYEGNEPVLQTIISSGRAPYHTVTGQFRVYYRLEEQTMDGRSLGFDYVTPGVPHVQYFYGHFAIHGATWHNDFGTPVSHGCVNVTPEDAEWLYNWMSYGTLVSVHY